MFVQDTPDQLLAHEVSTYRFVYKLSRSFGKKVENFNPPEGDWIRFVQPLSASQVDANAYKRESGYLQMRESDSRRGRELYEGTKEANVLGNAEEGAYLVANLRRELDRRMVPFAGDSINFKELKEIAVDTVQAWVQ